MKQIIDSTSNGSIQGTIISLNNQTYVITSNPNEQDKNHICRLTNDNETIESCCIYMTPSKIYCGIAYENKSLHIYDISQGKEIKPMTTYKTDRKVSSLSFHRISDEIAILTADAQGDVTAYPLTQSNKKRLLLGHTASILLDMKICNEQIFTCDRDEKIRVSSFPNAWNVEGYLLGHTDYVSGVDVSGEVCVSCSGDGTVRLWDYGSFRLLDTYSSENSAFLCLSTSGKYVAAIQQQNEMNPTIELFSIDSTIKHIQTISNEIYPISLKFLPTDTLSLLILCKEPHYIQEYRYNPTTSKFEIVSDSYYSSTISKLAKENNISMPIADLSHLRGGRSEGDKSTEEWNTAEKKNVARKKDNRRKYRKKVHS